MKGYYEMLEKELFSILRESSYPFLAAPKGTWIDGNDEELLLQEMKPQRIRNCYKYLLKQKADIKRGCFFEAPTSFSEAEYDHIIATVMNLYEKKLSELMNELPKQ